MVTVKTSDKQCVFCTKTDTVIVKAKEADFQGPVCMAHLRPLLEKWETKPEQQQS